MSCLIRRLLRTRASGVVGWWSGIWMGRGGGDEVDEETNQVKETEKEKRQAESKAQHSTARLPCMHVYTPLDTTGSGWQDQDPDQDLQAQDSQDSQREEAGVQAPTLQTQTQTQKIKNQKFGYIPHPHLPSAISHLFLSPNRYVSTPSPRRIRRRRRRTRTKQKKGGGVPKSPRGIN